MGTILPFFPKIKYEYNSHTKEIFKKLFGGLLKNGNPLQYSCLENPLDRGAWWATVHGLQRVRHN